MVRPQVNSSKHYIQKSLSTITGGAIDVDTLAKGVAVNDLNLNTEVREGSIIKAIYLEYWLRSSSTAPATMLITLYKKSGGDTNMTTAESADLTAYDNKKNIFYHTQGLLNDQDANAIAFLRGWFKIPKSKQRFGLNDDLQIAFHEQSTVDAVICGFATYKEYF